MPTWITPRRLGAAAVLYAVFVGGWYLGQPLEYVGCDAPEPAYASDPPGILGEPGDISDDLSRFSEQIVTYELVDTASVVSCQWEPQPRLVAWVIGDWR